MTSYEEKKGKGIFTAIMGGIGAAAGLWAFAALTFALSKSGWQVGELMRQYLMAVGVIGEYETLVDFYTHIKGVEYVICGAFFVAFPLFFKYVNQTKAPSHGH
jgi:hypothetical protein